MCDICKDKAENHIEYTTESGSRQVMDLCGACTAAAWNKISAHTGSAAYQTFTIEPVGGKNG